MPTKNRKAAKSSRRRTLKKMPSAPTPPVAAPPSETPSGFPVPVREVLAADRLLLVYADGQRDPLLSEYRKIMRSHGHASDELEVELDDPIAARTAIRNFPSVKRGEAVGIVVFGKRIPSFRMRYFYPDSPLVSRGYSDLPLGSDFSFFDTPVEPLVPDQAVGWDIRKFAAAIDQSADTYVQNQWVARLFELDDSYLKNLENTVPPQVHNMLIVNADPVFENLELNERVRRNYRARYSLFSQGHNARFGFLEQDFPEDGLFDFLEGNTPNSTFLSIADHGNSNNLVHLPPAQQGIAQLPEMPELVEFGACAVGSWMEEQAPAKSIVEVTLNRGALAAIGAQCLLAWNFAKGFVDPSPGSNPFDQDSFNVAPWLDVWPGQGSLGRAQAFTLSRTLSFLKGSFFNDKPHICFQMLCGHSLFGDGTLEFRRH